MPLKDRTVKALIKSTVIAALLLNVWQPCALAESLLYVNSGTLTFEGNVNPQRQRNFVSFIIYPQYVEAAELEIQDNSICNTLYKTAITDNDGYYKIELTPPSDFENGQYIAESYDNGVRCISRFGIADDGFDSDLSAFNAATTQKEMADALSAAQYKFDAAIISEYGNRIAEYLLKVKGSSSFTKEQFISNYNMAEGLARLEKSDITVRQLLVEYSAYTGVDYINTYKSLTEAGKNEIERLLLKKTGSIRGDFAGVYTDIFEIADIKGCTDSQMLSQCYTENAKSRNKSLKAYNELNSYRRETVFLNMLSKIENAETLAEIDAAFDSLVASETPSINSGGSGSGGGGGGTLSTANKPSPPTNNYFPVNNNSAIFSDISGHWAADYILDMTEKGIISGYEDNSFKPDSFVTRAEFLIMLCKAFEITGKGEISFIDVKNNDWFYQTICAAYENGIITGNQNNEFAPNEPISRQDAAVMLQRRIKINAVKSINFTDKKKISEYAVNAVNALAEAGIIKGYSDYTVKPTTNITRAEAAVLITRAGQQRGEIK